MENKPQKVELKIVQKGDSLTVRLTIINRQQITGDIRLKDILMA